MADFNHGDSNPSILVTAVFHSVVVIQIAVHQHSSSTEWIFL